MIIRLCDRCSKEIKNNYWTINIYQEADSTGRVSTEGAINNMKENTESPKEYCENCIKEIKKSIKKEKIENA